VRGGKSYLGVVRKEGSKTTEVMNYGKVKRVVESEQGKKDIVTLYNKRGKNYTSLNVKRLNLLN